MMTLRPRTGWRLALVGLEQPDPRFPRAERPAVGQEGKGGACQSSLRATPAFSDGWGEVRRRRCSPPPPRSAQTCSTRSLHGLASCPRWRAVGTGCRDRWKHGRSGKVRRLSSADGQPLRPRPALRFPSPLPPILPPQTMPENVKAEINCDCGESFGNWVLGPSLLGHPGRLDRQSS